MKLVYSKVAHMMFQGLTEQMMTWLSPRGHSSAGVATLTSRSITTNKLYDSISDDGLFMSEIRTWGHTLLLICQGLELKLLMGNYEPYTFDMIVQVNLLKLLIEDSGYFIYDIAFLAVTDTYFLINWLDDSDPDLYDVVSAKLVVPPEEVEILDVIAGTVCRVSYSGQYFKAEVLDKGTCM